MYTIQNRATGEIKEFATLAEGEAFLDNIECQNIWSATAWASLCELSGEVVNGKLMRPRWLREGQAELYGKHAQENPDGCYCVLCCKERVYISKGQ
jgi:hypothetical protein